MEVFPSVENLNVVKSKVSSLIDFGDLISNVSFGKRHMDKRTTLVLYLKWLVEIDERLSSLLQRSQTPENLSEREIVILLRDINAILLEEYKPLDISVIDARAHASSLITSPLYQGGSLYSKIVSSWKKWTEDSGETSLESQICSITETLEKMGILQAHSSQQVLCKDFDDNSDFLLNYSKGRCLVKQVRLVDKITKKEILRTETFPMVNQTCTRLHHQNIEKYSSPKSALELFNEFPTILSSHGDLFEKIWMTLFSLFYKSKHTVDSLTKIELLYGYEVSVLLSNEEKTMKPLEDITFVTIADNLIGKEDKFLFEYLSNSSGLKPSSINSRFIKNYVSLIKNLISYFGNLSGILFPYYRKYFQNEISSVDIINIISRLQTIQYIAKQFINIPVNGKYWFTFGKSLWEDSLEDTWMNICNFLSITILLELVSTQNSSNFAVYFITVLSQGEGTNGYKYIINKTDELLNTKSIPNTTSNILERIIFESLKNNQISENFIEQILQHCEVSVNIPLSSSNTPARKRKTNMKDLL